MNKDEAVKMAYTIAANVIAPDHIEAIINEHKHLLPDSEQDKQLVAEALRDVQLELQEKAEEVDVMTAEEEAEIDATLDQYRGADGKLDYDLLDKKSGPLPEDMQAEFDAIAYDEDGDSG
jgi:hypothetical protein